MLDVFLSQCVFMFLYFEIIKKVSFAVLILVSNCFNKRNKIDSKKKEKFF